MTFSRPLPIEFAEAAAFSRAMARVADIPDSDLRHRRVMRVSHGWYVQSGEPMDLLRRCHALTAVLPDDAVFSDITAAQIYGLPAPSLVDALTAPVHVTLTPRRCVPQRKDVVVHRRAMTSDEIAVVGGLPLTVPARLYADLAMTLPMESLAVIGDSLLRAGLVTTDTAASHLGSLRRRRGLALARQTLELLDGRAQSPPETTIRLRLHIAGIPAEPQCAITDRHGVLIGHADLGYRAARVALEYEGRQHSEGDQFDYDLDRYSRFAAAGWLVIRCGRRDLANGSAVLIERVRAALASR